MPKNKEEKIIKAPSVPTPAQRAVDLTKEDQNDEFIKEEDALNKKHQRERQELLTQLQKKRKANTTLSDQKQFERIDISDSDDESDSKTQQQDSRKRSKPVEQRRSLSPTIQLTLDEQKRAEQLGKISGKKAAETTSSLEVEANSPVDDARLSANVDFIETYNSARLETFNQVQATLKNLVNQLTVEAKAQLLVVTCASWSKEQEEKLIVLNDEKEIYTVTAESILKIYNQKLEDKFKHCKMQIASVEERGQEKATLFDSLSDKDQDYLQKFKTESDSYKKFLWEKSKASFVEKQAELLKLARKAGLEKGIIQFCQGEINAQALEKAELKIGNTIIKAPAIKKAYVAAANEKISECQKLFDQLLIEAKQKAALNNVLLRTDFIFDAVRNEKTFLDYCVPVAQKAFMVERLCLEEKIKAAGIKYGLKCSVQFQFIKKTKVTLDDEKLTTKEKALIEIYNKTAKEKFDQCAQFLSNKLVEARKQAADTDTLQLELPLEYGEPFASDCKKQCLDAFNNEQNNLKNKAREKGLNDGIEFFCKERCIEIAELKIEDVQIKSSVIKQAYIDGLKEKQSFCREIVDDVIKKAKQKAALNNVLLCSDFIFDAVPNDKAFLDYCVAEAQKAFMAERKRLEEKITAAGIKYGLECSVHQFKKKPRVTIDVDDEKLTVREQALIAIYHKTAKEKFDQCAQFLSSKLVEARKQAADTDTLQLELPLEYGEPFASHCKAACQKAFDIERSQLKIKAREYGLKQSLEIFYRDSSLVPSQVLTATQALQLPDEKLIVRAKDILNIYDQTLEEKISQYKNLFNERLKDAKQQATINDSLQWKSKLEYGEAFTNYCKDKSQNVFNEEQESLNHKTVQLALQQGLQAFIRSSDQPFCPVKEFKLDDVAQPIKAKSMVDKYNQVAEEKFNQCKDLAAKLLIEAGKQAISLEAFRPFQLSLGYEDFNERYLADYQKIFFEAQAQLKAEAQAIGLQKGLMLVCQGEAWSDESIGQEIELRDNKQIPINVTAKTIVETYKAAAKAEFTKYKIILSARIQDAKNQAASQDVFVPLPFDSSYDKQFIDYCNKESLKAFQETQENLREKIKTLAQKAGIDAANRDCNIGPDILRDQGYQAQNLLDLFAKINAESFIERSNTLIELAEMQADYDWLEALRHNKPLPEKRNSILLKENDKTIEITAQPVITAYYKTLSRRRFNKEQKLFNAVLAEIKELANFLETFEEDELTQLKELRTYLYECDIDVLMPDFKKTFADIHHGLIEAAKKAGNEAGKQAARGLILLNKNYIQHKKPSVQKTYDEAKENSYQQEQKELVSLAKIEGTTEGRRLALANLVCSKKNEILIKNDKISTQLYVDEYNAALVKEFTQLKAEETQALKMGEKLGKESAWVRNQADMEVIFSQNKDFKTYESSYRNKALEIFSIEQNRIKQLALLAAKKQADQVVLQRPIPTEYKMHVPLTLEGEPVSAPCIVEFYKKTIDKTLNDYLLERQNAIKDAQEVAAAQAIEATTSPLKQDTNVIPEKWAAYKEEYKLERTKYFSKCRGIINEVLQDAVKLLKTQEEARSLNQARQISDAFYRYCCGLFAKGTNLAKRFEDLGQIYFSEDVAKNNYEAYQIEAQKIGGDFFVGLCLGRYQTVALTQSCSVKIEDGDEELLSPSNIANIASSSLTFFSASNAAAPAQNAAVGQSTTESQTPATTSIQAADRSPATAVGLKLG